MPGHHTVGTDAQPEPSHGNHMQHFEVALKRALADWQWEETAEVTFQLAITPNPGGIKQYKVTLTS